MPDERQDADPYAEQINLLHPLEHVRMRPGMYIGDTGRKGLHWIVCQLVANSLAEAAEGHGHSVRVRLSTDGSIEVADDGQGIDPVTQSAFGVSPLEVVLTRMLAGSRPKGRIWPDYFIANALSEWLSVEIGFKSQVYRQDYRAGVPAGPPYRIGSTTVSGVKVTFKPDPSIFDQPRLTYEMLRERLREYAFLHSGVAITLTDETTHEHERFEFEDGIRSFVDLLNQHREPLHSDVLLVRAKQEGVHYEIGMQWCRPPEKLIRSFANAYETVDGGFHLDGLLAGLTNAARPLNIQATPGLTAVLSVRLAAPIFSSQARARLVNKEVQPVIEAGVTAALKPFFESHPAVVRA